MPARPANFHGLHIRKWFAVEEETLALESGPLADGAPVVKIVIAAAIANPYAGKYVDSLAEAIGESEESERCEKFLVDSGTSVDEVANLR